MCSRPHPVSHANIPRRDFGLLHAPTSSRPPCRTGRTEARPRPREGRQMMAATLFRPQVSSTCFSRVSLSGQRHDPSLSHSGDNRLVGPAVIVIAATSCLSSNKSSVELRAQPIWDKFYGGLACPEHATKQRRHSLMCRFKRPGGCFHLPRFPVPVLSLGVVTQGVAEKQWPGLARKQTSPNYGPSFLR